MKTIKIHYDNATRTIQLPSTYKSLKQLTEQHFEPLTTQTKWQFFYLDSAQDRITIDNQGDYEELLLCNQDSNTIQIFVEVEEYEEQAGVPKEEVEKMKQEQFFFQKRTTQEDFSETYTQKLDLHSQKISQKSQIVRQQENLEIFNRIQKYETKRSEIKIRSKRDKEDQENLDKVQQKPNVQLLTSNYHRTQSNQVDQPPHKTHSILEQSQKQPSSDQFSQKQPSSDEFSQKQPSSGEFSKYKNNNQSQPQEHQSMQPEPSYFNEPNSVKDTPSQTQNISKQEFDQLRAQIRKLTLELQQKENQIELRRSQSDALKLRLSQQELLLQRQENKQHQKKKCVFCRSSGILKSYYYAYPDLLQCQACHRNLKIEFRTCP